MEGSRFDARTVALAVLCLAVVAFAAATLDSTTSPGPGLGSGSGAGDGAGVGGTPTRDDPGESDDGRPSVLDVDTSGVLSVCVAWLTRPLVQSGLLLGVLAVFLAVRVYEDAAAGLAAVFLVSYPGFFVYLVLTSCQAGTGVFPKLSRFGAPTSADSGGLFGGEGVAAPPTLATQLLAVLVVGLLGVVAVVVLTGDHERLSGSEDGDDDHRPTERRADVAAVGRAAGRAADRLDDDGEFANEVYRAWAEMTDPLSVDRPESSTPAEFADAAVAAGMDPADVERLTDLFEEVRYGGADPTPERERAAVETLRRIEAAYADAEDTAPDSGTAGGGDP